jgi:two-component system, sensor histidine kinase and response regulator
LILATQSIRGALIHLVQATLGHAGIITPAFMSRRGTPMTERSGRYLHGVPAEDNLINQKLPVRLLEKQGHTVVVANNGREATEAAAKQIFDLVLMDVQMPEMNGLEATTLIRQREHGTGAHLPIIALTAGATKSDQEEFLHSGMDAYVAKPIHTKQLYTVLDSIPCNVRHVA